MEEAPDGTCLLQNAQLGQRSLLAKRSGDQRTEGCKTRLKMRIDNDLDTDLTLSYWTGVHGSMKVNGKTWKTKQDRKTRSVSEFLGNGRSLTVEALNSDAGGSGICNGAEGYMTFGTPSNTNLGLNQVILKYDHDGGKGDGSYNVNFNTRTYSADAIALYEAADHRKCNYQGGKTE